VGSCLLNAIPTSRYINRRLRLLVCTSRYVKGAWSVSTNLILVSYGQVYFSPQEAAAHHANAACQVDDGELVTFEVTVYVYGCTTKASGLLCAMFNLHTESMLEHGRCNCGCLVNISGNNVHQSALSFEWTYSVVW